MTAFVTRTVGDVVSEILMSRSVFRGTLLVLEGDDDFRFWKTRAAGHPECQFVKAGSKPTVVGAIVRADVLKHAGLLGVVDDDYDSILGLANPSVNLIRTETPDIEALMLSSPAFDRVLSELGDPERIHTLEHREGQSVRDAFVSRALIFGQLRYLNAFNRWAVAFDRLSP